LIQQKEEDKKWDQRSAELLPDFNLQKRTKDQSFSERFEEKRRKRLADEVAKDRELFLFSCPVFLAGTYLYLNTSYKLRNPVHRGFIPFTFLASAFAYGYSRAYGGHANKIESHIDDVLTNDKYWFVPLERSDMARGN